MNWWNKFKKPLVFLLLAIAILVFGKFVLEKVIAPRIFCTLLDCMGDGVQIIFVGEIPSGYSVEVDFPSGKRNISCFTLFPMPRDNFGGDTCMDDGAFFEQLDSQVHSDKPPESLTVTVEFFNGEQFTKTFQPEYHTYYPNGKYCDPMCYYAIIYFDISK